MCYLLFLLHSLNIRWCWVLASYFCSVFFYLSFISCLHLVDLVVLVMPEHGHVCASYFAKNAISI